MINRKVSLLMMLILLFMYPSKKYTHEKVTKHNPIMLIRKLNNSKFINKIFSSNKKQIGIKKITKLFLKASMLVLKLFAEAIPAAVYEANATGGVSIDKTQ